MKRGLEQGRTNNDGSRRVSSRKGAVVIEAGLTIVLLFGMMFLVIDLSMLQFTKSTLQYAVQEGVRTGVTGNLKGASAYLNDSIIRSVQDAALGMLNGTEGACRIGIKYFNPSDGSPSSGTQGDLLIVSVVDFNYTPLGAVLKRADPFAISASASDIVERCPVAGCPATVNPQPMNCP